MSRAIRSKGYDAAGDTWVLDDIGGQEVIKIVRRTERAHGIGEKE